MDKIKVYKTFNASDMATIQPYITSVLQSFAGFMSGKGHVRLADNGNWSAKADNSLTNLLPKANFIKTEKDAFDVAKRWMQKFDEKLSKRVFGDEVPKQLFDDDLMEVSASPEIKEFYGMKVPYLWHCYYRVSVKPDSKSKTIAVDNMELHLGLHSNNVVNIDYSYLPIKESIEDEKVIINQPLGLRYQNIPDKNLIIPYFFIVENEYSI
jgi:hypothetical protein